MIVAGVQDMAIALELRFIGHTFYYTIVSLCAIVEIAAYVPVAKTRAFTALFGKLD